jgi:hypothetical protein
MEKIRCKDITNFDEFKFFWNKLIELNLIANPTIDCSKQINLLTKKILDAEFSTEESQIDIVRVCKDSLSNPKSSSAKQTSADIYDFRLSSRITL